MQVINKLFTKLKLRFKDPQEEQEYNLIRIPLHKDFYIVRILLYYHIDFLVLNSCIDCCYGPSHPQIFRQGYGPTKLRCNRDLSSFYNNFLIP